MKNRFNLQMFADDPGDGAAEGNQTDGSNVSAEEESSKKTYTDEEVDKIIERKMAEWQKKQDKAKKEQDEAQKLKDMTDQQRADHELQALKDELERLRAKDEQAEMLFESGEKSYGTQTSGRRDGDAAADQIYSEVKKSFSSNRLLFRPKHDMIWTKRRSVGRNENV